MREIHVDLIKETVRDMCGRVNITGCEGLDTVLLETLKTESSDVGRDVLRDLVENLDIAKEKQIPICQDTGMAVFFVEIGQEVHFYGGSLENAINSGVASGYKDFFLRKSIVSDPFIRNNTGDNTPAVIYYEIVEGENLKISFLPKGFGSENMSRLKMLTPSEGEEGVMDFIINSVKEAGSNPCPPIVLGIGVGGTMEKCALLAKKALLRPIGEYSKDEKIALFEKKILDRINSLGIGPGGLGGNVTALWAAAGFFPTHIAGLPAAVNISCHAVRHETVII